MLAIVPPISLGAVRIGFAHLVYVSTYHNFAPGILWAVPEEAFQ